MKYHAKRSSVEAVTFDQLVKHGRDTGANIVDGMPWSFLYAGHPVTHENDDCYLVNCQNETLRMTRGQVLLVDECSSVRLCPADTFHALFEPADEI